MKTVLFSIASLIVLSQVAPSFYNLVGLEPGMYNGSSFVSKEDAAYRQGYNDARR